MGKWIGICGSLALGPNQASVDVDFSSLRFSVPFLECLIALTVSL